MAITYTWDTKTVDTYPTKSGESDVIFKVWWNLHGVDDTTEKNAAYAVTGAVNLDTSDLSSFTAFADVTESDVDGWVQAEIGADQINAYKSVIESEITEKATPTVVRKYIGE
jgi:hypothetical protein